MTSCVFLLLVVNSLSGLSPASSQSWEQFEKKHIDDSVRGGGNVYCYSEIRNRGITAARGQCKPKNTFIHSPSNTIKGLCTGIVGSQYITSNNPYYLTHCEHLSLIPQEMPPNCNYMAYNYYKPIMIKCDGGTPVHFEKIM
ncbi:sialic acid-binding lectin-like [Pleurodeles waltl]|uniref:sialic acid-binding lectin-like n=1 Tax=Pleurodeles waltl TaxID=8319 RepID=UPI0037096387